MEYENDQYNQTTQYTNNNNHSGSNSGGGSDIGLLISMLFCNIISILMVLIILFIIIFVIDYFNLFKHMQKNRLAQDIEDALNFEGFPLQLQQTEYVESEVIDKTKNNHILLFGGSDTGKTYYIKEYLKKNNITKYKVFCLDDEEWSRDVIEYDINKLNNLEYLRDYTIILDDQGSQKLDKQVANLISKGRHFNIQLIFLAHLSTDLNPKSRNNVKEIYITTGNSTKFFHDLKEKFMISDLSSFSHIEYGIIRYNLNKNSFIVYDKNYKKIYDSTTNKISTRSDFDLSHFINQQTFSELEKSEIVNFLESKAQINVTDPLFLYYLNYYLIQNAQKPNMSKLKNMLGDYYEEHSTFKSKNIIPLIKVFKEGYKEMVKKD